MSFFTQDDGATLRPNRVFLAILGAIGGLIGILAIFSAIFTIDAGEVGVVTRFGAITGRIAEPGLHFKTPFIEQVYRFEVRIQKEQVEAEAASRDLQSVSSTIAVNYHLEGTEAQTLYQELGVNYKERVIDPAIQEIFKASTAGFTAEELITRREEIKTHARELLKDRMVRYHIVVDDLNIVNFDFSADFNTAIEAKQVAQQEVEKAKRELERAKVDADRKITEATASAEAQRLQQQTLTPLLVQLEFLKKWNGILPLYLGGGLNTFLQIATEQAQR